MTDYSEHINFINTHSFRPHRDYNWGLFGLILTSRPDSTIIVYEPGDYTSENPVYNIWKFIEFPCSQRYIAKYINGIGELRTFDFSKNNIYKATTRLEAYKPISNLQSNVETNKYDVDSEEEETRI